jgi:hypothetical protein
MLRLSRSSSDADNGLANSAVATSCMPEAVSVCADILVRLVTLL